MHMGIVDWTLPSDSNRARSIRHKHTQAETQCVSWICWFFGFLLWKIVYAAIKDRNEDWGTNFQSRLEFDKFKYRNRAHETILQIQQFATNLHLHKWPAQLWGACRVQAPVTISPRLDCGRKQTGFSLLVLTLPKEGHPGTNGSANTTGSQRPYLQSGKNVSTMCFLINYDKLSYYRKKTITNLKMELLTQWYLEVWPLNKVVQKFWKIIFSQP